MYQIVSNGTAIATVDKLHFWKRQRNGVRINCEEREASGVIVNDQFYHLPWMPQSGGGEPDITYEAFDGARAIEELDNAVIDLAYQNILLEMEVTEHAV